MKKLVAFGLAVLGAATWTMRHGVAAEKSCDDLLQAPREVRGQKVGPSSCLMQDNEVTYDGRAYTRIDIGLDGSVDGFAAKVGDYKDYFTNGPESRLSPDLGAAASVLRRRQLRACEGRGDGRHPAARRGSMERQDLRDRPRQGRVIQGRPAQAVGQELQGGRATRRSRSL